MRQLLYVFLSPLFDKNMLCSCNNVEMSVTARLLLTALSGAE